MWERVQPTSGERQEGKEGAGVFTWISLQKTFKTRKVWDSSTGAKALQLPETNLTVINSPFHIYSKDIDRFSFYLLF